MTWCCFSYSIKNSRVTASTARRRWDSKWESRNYRFMSLFKFWCEKRPRAIFPWFRLGFPFPFLSPPPHNQIYSRFWYALSLFLSEFHSVNPFNGNFCEPGRAGSLRKRWNFHFRLSAKRTLLYFRPNSDLLSNSFRGRVSAVHDKRAEWTCSRNVLCSKMWKPPRIEVD